tara:strand:+ start:425 stop:700 length:276 start_codon:yes stop_codon:yes gene_type:complete
MAKKEKIVDLKSKPEKITAEQLKNVQETVNTINRAQMEVGSMELKKHALVHQINGVQEKLNLLQTELEKEYGTVDINIQDGTINYDVKADS